MMTVFDHHLLHRTHYGPEMESFFVFVRRSGRHQRLKQKEEEEKDEISQSFKLKGTLWSRAHSDTVYESFGFMSP